jgi:hypothetical protein
MAKDDTSAATAEEAKRGPGRPPAEQVEPLDLTRPVYVLIDQTPSRRSFMTFSDKAACDAEAPRITLATGRHVARFGPQYGVTAPVAQAAEMPLAFGI